MSLLREAHPCLSSSKTVDRSIFHTGVISSCSCISYVPVRHESKKKSRSGAIAPVSETFGASKLACESPQGPKTVVGIELIKVTQVWFEYV